MVKRIIDTAFWEDSTVLDKYTPEDKYFMLYLLTNPKTTSIGIYSLPKKKCAFDLGYSLDTVNFLLERFENNYQNIVYNHDNQEVAVLNTLKYTISKGGTPVRDMVSRELLNVKSTHFLAEVYNRMTDWWEISNRDIDNTIKGLFEDELEKRNSLYLINANANANANANTDSVDDSYNDSLEQHSDKPNESIPYSEIVEYLNEKTNSQYRPTAKKTQNLIKARYNDGFSIDDFKRVIDVKTAEWLNDNRMNKFLRPETLFGTKFESYLNQKSETSKNNTDSNWDYRKELYGE